MGLGAERLGAASATRAHARSCFNVAQPVHGEVLVRVPG